MVTVTAAQHYHAFSHRDAHAPGSPNHPTDMQWGGERGYQPVRSNGATELGPGLGVGDADWWGNFLYSGLGLRTNVSATSSAQTSMVINCVGPKLVMVAVSTASRPWAIRMRPMRGVLWRASNVYQRPPR
jgi:hypothetical protein